MVINCQNYLESIAKIMYTDLVKELNQLGLPDKEAQVYLLLLQQGRSTAQAIASAADMPRATCYGLLENLVSKGLVIMHADRDQREYVAEPPERLRTLLRVQAEELQERTKRMESVLPQLLALATDASSKPQVRLVKGAQDLQQLQVEYRDWAGETIQMVGYDALLKLRAASAAAHKEHDIIRQENSHASKSGRMISVTNSQAPDGLGIETRTLPASLLDVPGEMTVCGDRVALFGYTDDVVGVVIHSPAIAQTCRAILELAWRQAGDLEQKFKGR